MPETRGRIPPIIAGISALLILALLGVYLGDAISDKQVMFGSIGITAISIIIACIFIFKHKGRAEDKNNTSRDGGLLLLELLDESYQRLKAITRMTIKKLRSKKWEDMHESIPFYISSLTNIDIDSEIENIMAKNLYLFATGKTLTVIEDGKELAKKMKESPLFMRNPEDVSKDASILLKEKLPYLKKKIDRDRTYNKFLKKIERERDKYPSEDVSKAIDAFLDHSIKLNATWVLSTYDLDHMGDIESLAGRRLPMKLKIIMMGLPGRMDEEMRRLRNKVAISILNFHKENMKV